MKTPGFSFCYVDDSLQGLFHAIFPDSICRKRELLMKYMHEHPPGEWSADIQGVLLHWYRDDSVCLLVAVVPDYLH